MTTKRTEHPEIDTYIREEFRRIEIDYRHILHSLDALIAKIEAYNAERLVNNLSPRFAIEVLVDEDIARLEYYPTE